MVSAAADAAGAENDHVLAPLSKPANPLEVTHCDRDACPWASTVSASMSISTHSPAANGRLMVNTRTPASEVWVMVAPDGAGPSMRASTGPVVCPSLVML